MAHKQWFKVVRQHEDSLRIFEYMYDDGWWYRWYPGTGVLPSRPYQYKNADGVWVWVDVKLNGYVNGLFPDVEIRKPAGFDSFCVGDKVVIINHVGHDGRYAPLKTAGQTSTIVRFNPSMYAELEGIPDAYPTYCLEPAREVDVKQAMDEDQAR